MNDTRSGSGLEKQCPARALFIPRRQAAAKGCDAHFRQNKLSRIAPVRPQQQQQQKTLSAILRWF